MAIAPSAAAQKPLYQLNALTHSLTDEERDVVLKGINQLRVTRAHAASNRSFASYCMINVIQSENVACCNHQPCLPRSRLHQVQDCLFLQHFLCPRCIYRVREFMRSHIRCVWDVCPRYDPSARILPLKTVPSAFLTFFTLTCHKYVEKTQRLTYPRAAGFLRR